MLERKLIHHKVLRRWFYNKLIDAYFSDCSSIIDIGCGFGDFLIAAKSKNKLVVGIDLNITSLITLHTFGFDVVQCDALHLPFRDNLFDGAFFSHVIEHIPFSSTMILLREIKRIIKNKLIVVTPTQHRDFWVPGHITSYDKQKLTHVLEEAGFHVSKGFYDKCFIFKLPEREFLVTIFNSLPFIWLKMNIVMVAIKLDEVKYARSQYYLGNERRL